MTHHYDDVIHIHVLLLLLFYFGEKAAAGKQAQEQAAVEAKPEAVKGAKKPTKQVDDRIANSKGEGNGGEVKQPDTYGLVSTPVYGNIYSSLCRALVIAVSRSLSVYTSLSPRTHTLLACALRCSFMLK